MNNQVIERKNSDSLTRQKLLSSITIALFIATGGLWPLPGVEAATLHYWRFENNSGFLMDSAGSANLTGNAAQAPLPATGAGSSFPDFLSVPGGGSNAAAARFNGNSVLKTTITPITSDFTVEAFVHLDTAVDRFGKWIVGSTTDPRFSSTIAFILHVRLDQFAGTQPGELVLITSDGTSLTWMGSDFVLGTGIDYFVASAFDLSGNVSFWIQDLTNGGALQSVTNAHTATAINPIASFGIGDDGTGNPYLGIDGLIDEVRLSDTVLAENQLLVNNTVVPIPAAAWLFASGLIGLFGLIRRKSG